MFIKQRDNWNCVLADRKFIVINIYETDGVYKYASILCTHRIDSVYQIRELSCTVFNISLG